MNLRKLGTLAGVLLSFCVGQAFAVGLGEIELKSSLSEPLNAQIQIRNIGDLSDVEMLVGLASADDFKQAGVAREFLLTKLDFQIDLSNVRNPVIKVTSKSPINEPYLDFLVEMQWPSGRLLREYTLLMDLPTFVTGEVSPKKINAAKAAPSSSSASSSTANQSYDAPVAGDSYTVNGGDTLWGVAALSRPKGYGINQTMDAIYQLNPSAFINENKNLLKKGAVLRLPEGSQIDTLLSDSPHLDSPRAILEETSSPTVTEEPLVAEDYKDTAQAYETDLQDTAEPVTEGRLKLSALSPLDEDRASSYNFGDDASDELTNNDVFPDGVSDTGDELSKTQRENDELKARLSSLEDQLATMERMVELNADTAVALQSTEAAQPAPVKQPAQAKSKSNDEKDLAWWLYLLIFVIAVILILFLFMRSRKKDDEDDFDFQADFNVDRTEPVTSVATNKAQPTSQSAPVEAEQDHLDEVLLDDVYAGLELSDEEGIDPIEQARIYIDLGNPGEAETILKDALDTEYKNKSGLHLKLLEIYATANDWPQFDMQRAQLLELDDPIADSKATELRSPVDDDEIGSLESAAAEGLNDTVEEDRFDNNLDDAIDLDQLSSDIDLLDEEMAGLEADVFDDVSKTEPELEPPTIDESEEDEVAKGDDVLAASPAITDDGIDAEEECATKLELAQAYIDMDDEDGAKEMLEEIIADGTEAQQQEAQNLLNNLA